MTDDTTRAWTPIAIPGAPLPAGAYSPAVRAGPFVFVSGQTPRDVMTGEVVPGSVEAQTALTLDNVERVLAAAGAAWRDVVSVTVWLADENDWGRFNTYYRGRFAPPWPTRAVVGAQLRGILVEIAVVAYTGSA
jgi:2-iminobutanoate/2-iminopropanoate deaminase